MRNLKLVILLFLSFEALAFNFSFAGNPFVRNLLGTQLEIGLNQRSNLGALREGKAENVLSMQQEILYLNQYDLISELDKTKTENERLNVLDKYISTILNAVSNGKNMNNYEQTQVNYYNNLAKECESQIKSKNSEFSNAVKSYNYERAESISNEIAELRACIAKNEVHAKAHASYASATRSMNDLQKKANYLSENRKKIAKYYEILKPDLLKELYDISQTVNSNF